MAVSNLANDMSDDLQAFILSLGASTEIAHTWANDFVTRYSESQRHYHTLEHVKAMLFCLDESSDLIRDKPMMKLSIYFHDWVYDPQNKNNELESIEIFHKFARAVNLDEKLRQKVVNLIERTITHTLPEKSKLGEDTDMELFLDFDLEVLARSKEKYESYAKQIRAEYTCFEDQDYHKGRSTVLTNFLDRKRLYFSTKFYLQCEETARRNIKMELETLT